MRRLILLLGVLMLLTGAVHASDEITEQLMDTFGTQDVTDSLEEDVRERMDGIDIEDVQPGEDAASILQDGLQQSGTFLRQVLQSVGAILAVVLLCGILSTWEAASSRRVIQLAGTLALAAIGAYAVGSMLRSSADTLRQLKDFSEMMLPALSMACASAGGITAASSIYVGTAAFVAFLVHLVTGLLQPLVFVFIALATADAALDHDMLEKLRQMVGWLISTGLKAVLFIFSAYMTITGVISGSADAATVKAAKLTLSSVVPVVGSMISDAADAVVVGASALRNSMGVFGMLAVLAICIVPFLKIGMQYLALKFTVALSGTIGDKRHVGMVESLSSATGYLLAMTATCALLLLISFVCYIKAVTI